MVARSKAWVCCSSPAEIVGSNPTVWGMYVCLLWVLCVAFGMWWHTVTHGRVKWRGNWRMEWVASTLTRPRNAVLSTITNADAHTSAASSRLNWLPHRFKWTRPFRRKTKCGFCACAIRFRASSTGLCDGLITRPEESYRLWRVKWLWSRNS